MILDLDRLREAKLRRDPFDFVIVEDFVRPEHMPGLLAGFPRVRRHGSFPLEAVAYGAEFAGLAAELEGDALRREIERKFAIDLSGRPTMITVRGHSDGKDGRIHTDSATKLITLLLYMNPVWDEPGGRLRMLRRADDLDDYAAEVAPRCRHDGGVSALRFVVPRPSSASRRAPGRAAQLGDGAVGRAPRNRAAPLVGPVQII